MSALLAHTKNRRDAWRMGLASPFCFFSVVSFFFLEGTWRIGHHIYPCEVALKRWHPIFLFFWFVELFIVNC